MAKASTPHEGPTPKKGGTAGGQGSRRHRLASFEAARKREQRRRSLLLFLICGVLAAGLLAYPVVLFVRDYQVRNAGIAEAGVPVAAAGCDPVQENPATGSQEHVDDGTKVSYAQTPPDSGAHYATPAPFARHFYSTSDRPPVENLVHNLEHGYTVVWYRADAPADQVTALQQVAKTFSSDDYDPKQKFVAAPWSDADGGGFPEGKNFVLARWTADPVNAGNPAAQKGVRQACTLASGEAVRDFMVKYPVTNSPEPNGA